MEQEEYIVDGHKVTHSVHLGDREIFLAVQQDAPLPFYVGYMEVSYELGLARFSGIEGTTEYPQQLLERRQKIGAIERDIPRRDANTPEDREQFFMTVMGREYTDKAAAGAELLALCQTVVQRGEAMEIGSYRGFAMRLEYRAMEQAFVVGLRGAAVYFAELGTDVQGNLARLNNALNGMEAHLKKLTQEISEIEKQQENTRQELEKPFAQEQELAEKEARLSAVNALLNIDGKNSIPDLMDDTLDIEPPQRAAKDYER